MLSAPEELPPLFIRADGGAGIGWGHLMRSLSIAQHWADSGAPVLLAGAIPESFSDRTVSDGVRCLRYPATAGAAEDLAHTRAALEQFEALTGRRPWVTLDGYHFDSDYQTELRQAGYRLIVIDDNAHLPFYDADILLNQNIYAAELSYAHSSDTTLLLGTEYALLRSEFTGFRYPRRRHFSKARRLLVTLGGADPARVSSLVLEALQEVEGLDVVLVVGASNPDFNLLLHEAGKSASAISVVRDSAEMADLMMWADVAISAAGTTSWELCFMGLPALLIIVADNQFGIGTGLEQAGAAVNLGWHEDLKSVDIAKTLRDVSSDQRLRQRLSVRQQGLVDGLGVHRLMKRVQGHVAS